MKLLVILLLITTTLQAQDSWTGNDKIQHLNTSITLTFAGGQVIESITSWQYSNEIAAMTIFSAGIAKELLLDNRVSGKDITYNAVGVIIGYYVNRIINKKLKNN